MLKALVGRIKMKLPTLLIHPDINPDDWNNNIDIIYDSLRDIDMEAVYAENIKFTNDANPLTLKELQKIENKWLFFKAGLEGPYVLAFKPYNLQPKKRGEVFAKIYFLNMKIKVMSLNGFLDPDSKVYNPWKMFTVASFTEDYVYLTNKYDIYLAKSNAKFSFINWNQNPFTKQ